MTRLAARAAALAFTAGLAASTLGPASTPAAAGPAEQRAQATTRMVLRVVGCDACSFSAHAYRADGSVWSSGSRRVRDGRVVLRVPTRLTDGLTVSLSAPWERRVGAVGNVVFRYAGQRPGERVAPAEARAARRGSACFPGTSAAQVRLRVRVHRAHFPGTGGRATAAAAYTVVTQATTGNRERVHDGFLGSQDVIPCA